MYYIGTAGFSYYDWENIFYTQKNNKLKFYSKYFNVVEINSSFYVIPKKDLAFKLLNEVEENSKFKFIIKANKIFTHKRNYSNDEINRFKEFCGIYQDKLLTILFQFPYSFKNNKKNIDYLYKLNEDFKDFAKSFEFRHNSFFKEEIFKFFKKNNICFVNIDQPVISYSLKLTNIVTNNQISYFRFHGKNYKNWFSDNIKPFERYNYLYTYKNIKFLYYKIKEIETKTNDIIIIMNNHYKAKAVTNAIEFKFLFEEQNIENNFHGLNERYISEIVQHMKTTG